MALLMDGGLSTLEDLRAQDSGVLDVAHVEGIDVTAKLALAEREIALEVERVLRQEQAGAVEQVLVTDAVRRWHVLLSLEMVYRDAYFSQLNDRYGGRWRAYESESRRAAQRVLDGGIPMTRHPLARPAGVTAMVTPGVAPESTYWVQATFVDGQGKESAPSVMQTVFAPDQHGLAARVSDVPAGVSGWNLAIGLAPDAMKRQNASPLALDAEWTMGLSGLSDYGAGPVENETPEYYVERRRLWRQ